MSHQYPSISSRILTRLTGSVLCLIFAGTFVTPVLAQGTGAAAKNKKDTALEEVTVTGSRIVRRDYESNSPIVTIDSEQLESKSGLNIESYLNQLPNYNPASTPVTTQQDVQITPVNSVGIATISLRGFGANRNLVLVDGKRPVPQNALMVTDINQIPSAMIQRVETITGGASAVYGADAVGGVTNFILRKNFEGLDMDAQYTTTEAGDGTEYRGSAVLGTNFSNNRGNLTVGMEYYKREIAYNNNRDFYKKAWKDPNTPGNFIGFIQGQNGYNCAFNCPAASTANALFPNAPAGTTISNPGSYFDLGAILGLPPGIITPKIGFVSTFYFNPDGTVYYQGSRAGLSNLDQSIVDGYKYALQNVYDGSVPTADPNAPIETQQLKYDNTNTWTEGPQERYSIMLNGHYDITDKITFNASGTFAQSKTRTLLGGNNAIFGWEADIPYNPATDSPIDPAANVSDPAVVAAILANPAAYANPGFIPHGATGAQHPVPMDLAILLNSRATPDAPWIPNWNTDEQSFNYRSTEDTNTVWQVSGGLHAELPFKDWTGELYFSHGESSSYNVNHGNMSLSRYRAIAGQPDYGLNSTLQGNGAFLIPGANAASSTVLDAASTNFGTAIPSHCTTGFYDTYFSGNQRPSDDCIKAINANLQTRTWNSQNIIEVNLQGGVFDLPAGEVRGAVGFQYRRNESQFVPDVLQSVVSFTDQVVGVYPSDSLDAYTSVNDFYAEALIPIVKDLPFMQKLELETGARHSDYNVSDSTWTYKFLANWQVKDWLRLRGGFNRASRAPNLGELFLKPQEIFVGAANFGDPCGWHSNAPWGDAGAVTIPAGFNDPYAGGPAPLAGGQTAAGAMSTYMICLAQMGDDGTGTGAGPTAWYNGTLNSGAAAAGFNWVLQQGNANLQSEKADTFTAGLVMNSPFDNPWLSGLTFAIDWWKVDINHAIETNSIDYSNYLCYGAVQVSSFADAQAQAATPACQNVLRSKSTGGPLTATLIYNNLATINDSGIDFSVNWTAQLSDLGFDLPGGVGINVQASWLDYYKTKASSLGFDVTTDWKGSLGPNLTGTNAGAYDYRVFTNFSYSQDNWAVSLRWRHLPSVISADQASENAIIKHNQAVAAGAPGYMLSYTPGGTNGPFLEVGSYDVLDLAVNWNYNETWSLRAGVDNLADFEPNVAPPGLTGSSGGKGYGAGTDLNAVCGGAPGCVNPTAYSHYNPALGNTNAGYYDTLGRRFFIGIKASF